MLPRQGPCVFSVPAFQNVSIAAGTTLTAPQFTWPRPLFCTSILLVPKSGLVTDLALLELSILDETLQPIFFDSSGNAGGYAMPALAMSGLNAYSPFPVQRPVRGADQWTPSVFNRGGAAIAVASLCFFFEEGDAAAA